MTLICSYRKKTYLHSEKNVKFLKPLFLELQGNNRIDFDKREKTIE